MAQHRMRLTRATDTEIKNLRDLLHELEAPSRFNLRSFLPAIYEDQEEFPILSKFDLSDAEEFLDDLSLYLSNMRWEVVLFNLDVLIDNAVDQNQHTLEWKPEIARAIEFYEQYHQQEIICSDPGDECDSVSTLLATKND